MKTKFLMDLVVAMTLTACEKELNGNVKIGDIDVYICQNTER